MIGHGSPLTTSSTQLRTKSNLEGWWLKHPLPIVTTASVNAHGSSVLRCHCTNLELFDLNMTS